jgi:muramidase (phage lysozyme)
MEESSTNTDKLQKEFEELSRKIMDNAGSIDELGAAAEEGGELLEKFSKQSVEAALALAKGFAQATKEVAEGNTKFTAMNKAVDGAAAASTAMAKTFGKGAEEVTKQLTDAVGDVSKFLLAQIDKYGEAWQSVSESGIANSITDLEQKVTTSGLKLDQYSKIVNENSKALANFRGLASDGADAFSKITNQLAFADTSLRKIGMSAEDIGDATAKYIAQQTRLGLSQKMTNQELTESARDYLMELDEMSKVTGASRKEMQQFQDKLLNEDRFRANLEVMQQQGKGKEADEAKKLATYLGDTGIGKGFRDLIGGVNTEEGQQLARATPEVLDVVKRIKEGSLDADKGFEIMRDAAEKAQHGLANFTGTATDASKKAFGSYHEYADLAAKRLRTEEGDQSSFDKAKQNQQEQLKQTDKLTDAYVTGQKDLEQYHRDLQLLSMKLMPAMADATVFATDKLRALGDVIQERIVGNPEGFSTNVKTPGQIGSSLVDEAQEAAKSAYHGIKRSLGLGEKLSNEPVGTGTKGLLDRIAIGEGTSDANAQKHGFNSGYDVSLGYGAYGGGTSKPLSEMTIAEVKEYQKRMLADPKNKMNSSAVGKYQIVGKTLRGLQSQYGIKDDEKFDAAMQDRLGEALLKQRGLDSMKSGKISEAEFQHNLSMEWASIADNSGKSHYGQHTGTSAEQIQSAIASAKTDKSAPAQPNSPSPTTVANAQPTTSTTTTSANAQPTTNVVAPTINLGQNVDPNQVINLADSSKTVSPAEIPKNKWVPTANGGEVNQSGWGTPTPDNLATKESELAAMEDLNKQIMSMGESPEADALRVKYSTMDSDWKKKYGESTQAPQTAPMPAMANAFNSSGMFDMQPSTIGGPTNRYNSSNTFMPLTPDATQQQATAPTTPENDMADMMSTIMTSMNDKMDSLVSLMRTQVSTSDKMLKATS